MSLELIWTYKICSKCKPLYISICVYISMRYIGINLDEEQIEKLKVISFITNKNRTDLIKEGIDIVIENNSDSFDEFHKFVKKLEKK